MKNGNQDFRWKMPLVLTSGTTFYKILIKAHWDTEKSARIWGEILPTKVPADLDLEIEPNQ